MKQVVIIGGGIIGQFCAYYLAKGQNQVTVIDDAPDLTPASEGNCGLVTPSHVSPLNSVGMVLSGLKMLGKSDAPLRIKPQLSRRFIYWFLNFLANSGRSSRVRAAEARHALLQQSFALYEEFFRNESQESEWKKGGLLYACKSQRNLGEIHSELTFHKDFGLPYSILSPSEIQDIEPLLQNGLAGGVLMETDCWLNPTKLLQDLKIINEQLGVKYINSRTGSFEVSKGRVIAARGAETEFKADEFVLAAGAFTPLLAAKLGIALPVIPGKGYNLTCSNEHLGLRHPTYFFDKKVVATPWKNSFRIGSTMEFCGYDLSLNTSRLAALKEAANEYLNVDFNQFELTPWAGFRPMKDDGIPIIKRSKISNVIVATGHSMVGLSMAPATGYVVNEIVSEN